MKNVDSVLCDVRYAIDQCRRGDPGRAIDALERVEAELKIEQELQDAHPPEEDDDDLDDSDLDDPSFLADDDDDE